MEKIINIFSSHSKPTGKSPWITFNKKDIADSQISLESILKQMPEKDISSHLTPEQKAVARGFRAILEDHFYFCVLMNRWAFGDLNYLRDEVMAPFPYPGFLVNFGMGRVAKQIKQQAVGQGIGRHSKEEILDFAEKDWKVNKVFLLTIFKYTY